jgi:hypothetical protein
MSQRVGLIEKKRLPCQEKYLKNKTNTNITER